MSKEQTFISLSLNGLIKEDLNSFLSVFSNLCWSQKHVPGVGWQA